jgi:hypothetical protein
MAAGTNFIYSASVYGGLEGGATDGNSLTTDRRLHWFAVSSDNSAFMRWHYDYGLAGADADESADPDSDGLNNLYEYGLGGVPTNGNDAGYIPVFGISGGQMEYAHVALADPNRGIDYIVETTTNLVSGTWTTGGVTTVTGSVDADFNLDTCTVPMDGRPEDFIRLRIGKRGQ